MKITRVRALRAVGFVACAVMAAAAINALLGWAFIHEYPGDLWFFMLLGAMPLIVAALTVGALPGVGKPAVHGQSVRRLRAVAGMAIVPIVLSGFYTALGAGLLGLSDDSFSGRAFNVWQYTFVAAVIADLAVFVLALFTPTQIGIRSSPARPSQGAPQPS